LTIPAETWGKAVNNETYKNETTVLRSGGFETLRIPDQVVGVCAGFLDNLYRLRVHSRLPEDAFINLMLEYLRVLLKDKMADRAKSILIKLEVIECDNQFIRGRRHLGIG